MRLTRFLIAMVAAASFAATAAFAAPPLRVCADPNNLPFSNARSEGFENKMPSSSPATSAPPSRWPFAAAIPRCATASTPSS